MDEDSEARAAELAELRAENARLAAEVAFENGRFRALLENASVPMLVTSFEFGRFLDLNQAYADYMGFPRAEILAGELITAPAPLPRHSNAQRAHR